MSNAARQVCGAMCLTRFCGHFGIDHPDIDALITHLWSFAEIANPDEFVAYDRGLHSLAITGMGDPMPEGVLAAIPANIQSDFQSLVGSIVEIGMRDAYGADTESPIDFLLQTFRLLENHGISVPNLKPFLMSRQNNRWGMPVAPDVLAVWQSLDSL